MTSLKVAARKAFLEEPPFPNSVFEKFAEEYINGLEAHLTKLVVEGFGSEHVQFSPQEKRGFNTATNEALNYLRGKLNE